MDESTLFSAVRNGDVKTMCSILEKCETDVNVIRDSQNQTLLMEACHWGHIDVVRSLLNKWHTCPNVSGWNGQTALMVSTYKVGSGPYTRIERTSAIHSSKERIPEAWKIFEEILSIDGIDVNKRSDFGQTALSFAIVYRQMNCVKKLIAHGADVYSKDVYHPVGYIPDTSSQRKHDEIILYIFRVAIVYIFGSRRTSRQGKIHPPLLPMDLIRSLILILS
jgi:ankyrin repeat protein